MKFLAMLRDSLREAIDAKIFYVMVGLSLLLTVLAFTLTFTPVAGGENMFKTATIALTIHLTEEDLADFEPRRLQWKAQELVRARSDIYDFLGARPVDGSEDVPSSSFDVYIRAHYADPERAAAAQKDPETAYAFIRERFGQFGRLRLADVSSVQVVKEVPANLQSDDSMQLNLPGRFNDQTQSIIYEVRAKPTSAARRLWPHRISLFFGALPIGGEGALGGQVYFLMDYIVCGIGEGVALLVSIVLTAFFIPNMLRKGTIDLLLVKPIHRWTLLLYKYIGGMTFMFLNTVVAVGGVWLALGFRSGIWSVGFLLTILITTFFFAILYACSTLFGVLTRSAIVCILMSCLFWVVLFVVGWLYVIGEVGRKEDKQRREMETIQKEREEATKADLEKNGGKENPPADKSNPRTRSRASSSNDTPWFDNWFFKTIGVCHAVLPRTRDMDILTTLMLTNEVVLDNRVTLKKHPIYGVEPSWTESLSVSAAYIFLFLGLSYWRFATQDY
jgi:ABC-type transport system involved in multi-copper enzyme maturation permease subunit